MKKLAMVALATAIALIGGQAAAQQKSRLHVILETGVIRVGTTGDFNPMTVRDVATNAFKGFEIDAANQLASDLGVRAEFVVTDWKTMIAGVVGGKYDIVMSGTSLNVGRAKSVGYTIPYVEVGTIPMVLKSNAGKFKTWDDANKPGVTVAVILGTVFDEQAKQHFPNATIRAIEAPATGYQEVLGGRAEVTITSNLEASTLMQKYDQFTTFGQGELRNRRPLAYIAPQNDLVWLNFLDHWVTLKKTEGFFAALSEKWRL